MLFVTPSNWRGSSPRERRRTRHGAPRHGAPREGALMCVELVFVLPLLLLVVFAILEFGCLWSANIRVKAASQAACRVATLPAETPDDMMRAVRRIAEQSLGSAKLSRSSHVLVDAAEHAGEPVTVEVRVPMSDAAPNLLAMFGWRLDGRELVGRTVMRKE